MASAAAVPPFMGATKSQTPRGFAAAIFGAPHGTPYPGIDNGVHRGAPDAFRNALRADTDWLSHWDWDLGGPLLKRGQTVLRSRQPPDQAQGRPGQPRPDREHDPPHPGCGGSAHHVRRR